jgi:glycosyltransferase involved in cell wall biosynthesis
MRVLLAGAGHDEQSGVTDGYGAVAHARWFHQRLDLIRVSPWAPSREEPLDDVQEFHVALSTAEMTRLLHSCDAIVVPAHGESRLPLVACEALAAGVPALLSEVPALTSLDAAADYAVFGPERNAVELGERLIELLSDADLRERIRTRGREVSRQWRPDLAAERFERFLEQPRG